MKQQQQYCMKKLKVIKTLYNTPHYRAPDTMYNESQ